MFPIFILFHVSVLIRIFRSILFSIPKPEPRPWYIPDSRYPDMFSLVLIRSNPHVWSSVGNWHWLSLELTVQTSKPSSVPHLKFEDSRRLVVQHISWSQVLTENIEPRYALGPSPAHNSNPLPASSSATKRTFNKSIKHDAAEFLVKSKCYSRLRTIDASVPSAHFHKLTAELTHKQASLLVQLRTGHIPLNHHLARIGVVQSPLCPACREREETVHHFLLGCTAYASQCQELYAKLSRDAYSIPHLLAHPKALALLFRYISATGRLRTTFDDLIPDRQRTREPTP